MVITSRSACRKMQQGRLLTLVNIQSASDPVAGQFSVGGNSRRQLSRGRRFLAQFQEWADASSTLEGCCAL